MGLNLHIHVVFQAGDNQSKVYLQSDTKINIAEIIVIVIGR